MRSNLNFLKMKNSELNDFKKKMDAARENFRKVCMEFINSPEHQKMIKELKKIAAIRD